MKSISGDVVLISIKEISERLLEQVRAVERTIERLDVGYLAAFGRRQVLGVLLEDESRPLDCPALLSCASRFLLATARRTWSRAS